MKWLHKLLKGVSFATALFIFQACYGPPMDLHEMGFVSFCVLDEDSGEPLEGIEVYLQGDNGTYIDKSVTDEAGHTPVIMYGYDALMSTGVSFALRSPDDKYFKKDTTFHKTPDEQVIVKLKKTAE